ncbi:hypothetical protein ACWEGE_25190 [Amycolatopsis sp. NPDC004747]
MSSTANARRDAPVRPALTPGETEAPYARVRVPRPWTASLQRPAAKILVAGGLTLAGWLLGAALSGSTASAAERPACPEAPVVSTVDHVEKPIWHARHRKNHHGTGESTCVLQPKADSTDGSDSTEPAPADEAQPRPDEPAPAPETTKDGSAGEPATTTADSAPAEEPAPESSSADEPATPESSSTAEQPGGSPAEEPAITTKATRKTTSTTGAPKATSSGGNLLGSLVGGTLQAVSTVTTKDTTEAPVKTTSAGGDLLGGLVGGVVDVVGGTLTTVTNTVGAVTDTLSHTVLAPLTQPPAGHPDGPVLLPIDDILGPLFGGGSNSGGVIATVPGLITVTTAGTQAPAAVLETVPATTAAAQAQQQTTRVVTLARLVVRQSPSLPAVQEQPRDSGIHASGGSSTPGLPGGTTAPSAPAPTAAPGHDGSGGARHTFAVHTDDVTTTQLKLIGTSRDHEVDGAGREAALPTTSPD